MTQSIIGQCAECCDCPVPILRTAVRSKSAAKCGFDEYTPSGDTPRVYLKLVERRSNTFIPSGDSYFYGSGAAYANAVWSGPTSEVYEETTITYDPATCTASDTTVDNLAAYGSPVPYVPLGVSHNGDDCNDPAVSSSDVLRIVATWPTVGCGSTPGGWTLGPVTPTNIYSYRDTLGGPISAYGSAGDYCASTGAADFNSYDVNSRSECNLSDEYTTTALIAYLRAGLAAGAYSGYTGSSSPTTALLAYIVVSEDGLSASAYQTKFRHRHKVSRVGSGCYRVLRDMVYVPPCGLAIASLTTDAPLGGYEPGAEFDVTISAPSVGGCPDAEQATATAVANDDGVLEFTLDASGMGYGAEVTASVDGRALLVHLAGAEEQIYTAPAGAPPGYNPSNPATYRESPEVVGELPEGVTGGAVYLMNIRSTCRGCSA